MRHAAAASAVAATTLGRSHRRTPLAPALARAAELAPVAGVIGAALLYMAACPPYEWSLAAWIAPGLLLVATRGLSPARGLACGLLFGGLFGLCITGWTFHATLEYFAFDRLRAGAFVVAMWLVYAGIPYGLLLACYGIAARVTTATLLPLVGAWLWVASEWLRATMLTGLPWELLGATQFRTLPLIQIADLGGVYAVSFVVALVGIAAAELARDLARGEPRAALRPWRLALPLGVLIATLAYGSHAIRAHRAPAAGADPRTIAIVQAQLPTEFRWKRAFFARAVATYGELTSRVLDRRPDLIVWPENAVNFYLADEPLLAAQLGAIAATASDGLLVGGPRLADDGLAHNSAYLLTAAGVRAAYDKQRLVPFAEYDPFRRARARGDARPDTYAPGREARPLPAGSMQLGTMICYEALFPRLARDLVHKGAQVLVNISNDAWLDSGDGTAPRQHFSQVVFRAIENRRYMVRASDSGVSGFITPYGRTYAVIPDGSAGSAVDLVVPMDGRTWYGRFGDAWILVGGLLVGAAACRRSVGRHA